MRFDWYQSTLPAEPDEALAGFLGEFDGATIHDARPIPPFEQGVSIRRDDVEVLACYWGGVNGLNVHAKATGADADQVARVIRREWPNHRVSRADVAEDYRAPEAWEVLEHLAKSVADDHRVKLMHVGDFHRCEDGRTLYLGAKQSAVRVRVYEKGKQLLGQGFNDADPDHVRAEVQCRPQKDAKSVMAHLTPQQMWGASRWSLDMAQRLGAEDLERIQIGSLYRQSDLDRAYRHLLKQYGSTLRLLCERSGSWEALGAQIGRDLMS